MAMKYYPVAKPYITSDEINAVTEVLKSGNLSLGPKYALFEKEFANKIGTRYACAVSSGTAGLHLAMIAAGIGVGDEVITSPFSFIASANSILYVGAKPIFVDIDSLTYNMDPAHIEAKINKKTKAILVVHIFGQSTDMDPVFKLAKKYKLKIIEDACESIGATYKGKNVGTFGESAVFAFYPNKQMTTGEGGILVTNSKKTYSLCSSLRNQGRSENMQWLDHERLGYNYRMDEMSAALGLAQLSKLDFMLKERKKIASWYTEYLKPYQHLLLTPQVAPYNTHSWFVYIVKIKNIKSELVRNKIIKNMGKEGIATKPYLPAIHLFSFYKKQFGYQKNDFPIAEKVAMSSLSLPFYIGLKKEDIRCIVGKLIKIIQLTKNG
jgi:perosamine synthetase